MSCFYFELIIEFLNAVTNIGNFSNEDVIVIHELAGKIYLIIYVFQSSLKCKKTILKMKACKNS